MSEHETSRTLVKSLPELWAECSDAPSLARHLGAFGEIRITRLEPESTVAWEGDAARGTVRLEAAGWGTRVTLTVAEEADGSVEAEPIAPPEASAAGVIEPSVTAEAADAPPRAGFFARLFRRRGRRPVAEMPPPGPEPEPDPEPPAPEPGPDPQPIPPRGEAVLAAALDSLGRAHHRPFSRA